jgi:RsiW-degrading membrane proteinase PrsW (M82 family)
MMLEAKCECGKPVRVNEELAGQQICCIRCGRTVQIPGTEKPVTLKPEPAPEPTPAAAATAPPESFRDYLYWLLIMAFFPLVLHLAAPQERMDFEKKLEETLRSASSSTKERARDVVDRIKRRHASLDELFSVLPGRRLAGAWLPRNTDLHWAFAGASALLFWLVVGSCFPGTRTSFTQLLAVGTFTGTLGVAILLSLHSLPFVGEFIWLCMSSAKHGAGDLLVLIAAYTLGVGLIEEMCKLIPILWYFKKRGQISWRRACLWGLASGVGFGVSEGIVYSETMYNGIFTMDAYLVRFLSCVVLHAVWTASAALALFHNQEMLAQLLKPTLRKEGAAPRLLRAQDRDQVLNAMTLSSGDQVFAWTMIVLKTVAVVMVFHGVYDAALSNDMPVLALSAALASFAWFVYQVETARQQEAPAPVPTPAAEAT